jgi:hypothetical protein
MSDPDRAMLSDDGVRERRTFVVFFHRSPRGPPVHRPWPAVSDSGADVGG